MTPFSYLCVAGEGVTSLANPLRSADSGVGGRDGRRAEGGLEVAGLLVAGRTRAVS
ncbi:hypothetical protein GCM10023074_53500 [Microbispora amethystogenes]|uniref:Uncharacterized protein n=1 Tax=Microbispora amethystogenes TaxID=1427754 RepID=A0ABQ4FHE9_9ACTN|nr:hypothetical protein Mam01_43920 [Microbispora amethystogenes]